MWNMTAMSINTRVSLKKLSRASHLVCASSSLEVDINLVAFKRVAIKKEKRPQTKVTMITSKSFAHRVATGIFLAFC